MKIYGTALDACTQVVLLAVAEKGHAVELVPVDPHRGEDKSPAYRAGQPFGEIPVLDEDGPVYGYLARTLDLSLLPARAGREVLTAARTALAVTFGAADSVLAGQGCFAGRSFSLADISWLPCLHYLFRAGHGEMVTEWPNLAVWRESTSNHPTWKELVRPLRIIDQGAAE